MSTLASSSWSKVSYINDHKLDPQSDTRPKTNEHSCRWSTSGVTLEKRIGRVFTSNHCVHCRNWVWQVSRQRPLAEEETTLKTQKLPRKGPQVGMGCKLQLQIKPFTTSLQDTSNFCKLCASHVMSGSFLLSALLFDLRPQGGWTKAKGHMNVEIGELNLETCREVESMRVSPEPFLRQWHETGAVRSETGSAVSGIGAEHAR